MRNELLATEFFFGPRGFFQAEGQRINVCLVKAFHTCEYDKINNWGLKCHKTMT